MTDTRSSPGSETEFWCGWHPEHGIALHWGVMSTRRQIERSISQLSIDRGWQAKRIDLVEYGTPAQAAPNPQDLHDVKVLLQAIYDLIDDEDVAEPLDYAITHAKKALEILGRYSAPSKRAASPPSPVAGEAREKEITRLATIAKCAEIAAKHNDCGGDFIAQKIRDEAYALPSTDREGK